MAPRGAIDPHAREQASRRGPPAEIEAMLDAVPALTALRSPPDPAELADLFETFDVTQSEPLQTARLQITPELVPAQENPTAARWRKSSVAGTGSEPNPPYEGFRPTPPPSPLPRPRGRINLRRRSSTRWKFGREARRPRGEADGVTDAPASVAPKAEPSFKHSSPRRSRQTSSLPQKHPHRHGGGGGNLP